MKIYNDFKGRYLLVRESKERDLKDFEGKNFNVIIEASKIILDFEQESQDAQELNKAFGVIE